MSVAGQSEYIRKFGAARPAAIVSVVPAPARDWFLRSPWKHLSLLFIRGKKAVSNLSVSGGRRTWSGEVESYFFSIETHWGLLFNVLLSKLCVMDMLQKTSVRKPRDSNPTCASHVHDTQMVSLPLKICFMRTVLIYRQGLYASGKFVLRTVLPAPLS